MGLLSFLAPKPTISDKDLSNGLRWMALEGGFSIGFFSITTSGFLAAFALALGANNLQIGILAALPFAMQIVQIPSIWLVERVRRRKLIAVSSWFSAQLLWIPMALIPLFMDVPGKGAISVLLLLMTFRGIFSAICNTAWNGWIRDLIPQTILGQFFSRRLVIATVMSMLFSLGAAFFVDFWEERVVSQEMILGYVYVFLFGAIFLGMASPVMMALIPEPLMQPAPVPHMSLKERLVAPLRDRNFRRLLQFLLFWGFASNLAIPFFAVYMLVRLGFPLAWVIGFSILSQVFNIIFLRVWGHYVDRFGSKAVLSVCVSIYLLVILGWIFTTMPERYFLTIPLIFILHIFMGIATAGVNITIATIGLKLAPQGEATSYLAGASLAVNVGAGLGPLCGGFLADFFINRQLNLTLSWMSPDRIIELPALSIIGHDFLFAIAFVLGLTTLSMLSVIKEEGEVSRDVILKSLVFPARDISRPPSAVPQYNLISTATFGYLRRFPLPGLDAVLGVTAYQIAEAAKAATSATIRGKKLTTRLVKAFERRLARVWKTKAVLDEHAVEITREATRGAMHVVDEKPISVDELIEPVATGIVEASKKAGIQPMNGIKGASQGVIQGAAETGLDLSEATQRIIEAARKIAEEMGISQEEAIIQAARGILTAAEEIGPEAAAEVVDNLPEQVFTEHEQKDAK
ncbi:MAG TPA: MFS transporter [Dehalococcoidia bacterium]|nr:MFS transporter [Dehalococcoidia bacterium]